MTSIAEDLQKWRKFVVTFLTKKIKRGSFPQCKYFNKYIREIHAALCRAVLYGGSQDYWPKEHFCVQDDLIIKTR